jgi:putative membrane protein
MPDCLAAHDLTTVETLESKLAWSAAMSPLLKTSTIVTLFVLFSFALVFAQDTASSRETKSSPGFSAADSTFMKKAADGGMAEVELGQLAVQKASSPDVKAFGQRMVDDHGKANEQLKQLAAEKHVDLPQEPGAKHKATKARLERLSGADFDQAYVEEMVNDHKKDVAEFQRESKTAKDDDLKNFAAQTLPTLQDHLKQIESIAPKQQSETSSTQKP